MSDVIRNVVIKLQIQQQNLRLKLPDTTAVTNAAKTIETAYKTTYQNVSAAATAATSGKLQGIDTSALTQSATQMSQVFTAELGKIEAHVDIINAKLQQMGSRVAEAQKAASIVSGASATAPQPRGASPTGRDSWIASQVASTGFQSMIRKELADEALANAARVKSAQATNAAVTSHMLQAGDSYKMAAEGAFHLARGIIFLNVTSETELALLVKKLAYYQGVFDIFRGSFDIVKGLAMAQRNLAMAYAVASAAAIANGTTLTAMSFTMDMVTAKAIAMWTAITGPVGLVVMGVVAVTAAVVGGVYAWNKYGTAAQEAAAKQELALKKQAEAARQARIDIEKLTDATQRQKNFEGSTGTRGAIHDLRQSQVGTFMPALLGMTTQAREQYTNTVAMKDIQAKLTNNSINAAKQRADFITAAARQANIQNKDRFVGQSAGFGGSIGPESIAKVANDAAKFAALQEKLKSLATAPRGGVMSNNAATEEAAVTALQRQKELFATIGSQLTAQNKSQEERLSLLGQQRAAVQKVLDLETTRHAAAKQALIDEENRRKSAIQKFGELQPAQQAQLKSLGAQVKAGGIESLNEGQLQLLRQSGFGQSIISKLDYKKGTAAGGDKFLSDIDEFKPGNTDKLEEGQGADQTRADFFKKVLADSKSAIAKQEAAMAQLLVTSRQASDKLQEGIQKLADMQPFVDAVEAALKKRDEWLRKLQQESDVTKTAVQRQNDNITRGSMSAAGP